MSGLQALAVLFFLVFIIGFLIPYVGARQKTEDYRRGKRKFNVLSNKLLQLKEHASKETDRWPIYARPVLFTDIDHKAQVEFAKVQQALNGTDQILPEIVTIEEPKTPEQFSFNDFLNVPRNLKSISELPPKKWTPS